MQKLYSLVILLPDEVEELILQFRREIAEKFGSVAALRPAGQITLQETFLYDEHHLRLLCDRFDEVFHCTAPFEVHFENFGAFPPDTLFAAIGNFFPFQQLRESLYCQLRDEPTFPQSAVGSRKIIPHVKVASGDLTAENFQQAWNEFSARELSSRFTASSAHLLELRGKWRPVKEFWFAGAKQELIESLQLDLFCA